jgi:uncharacterized protein YbaP (TraB family)
MNVKRNVSMILTAMTALFIILCALPLHAEPALWVVRGPHATVYLFGSVHVLKRDQPWRSAKIDAAIGCSDALWLEVTDADDAKLMQQLIAELGVDASHPLSSKLSKEQVARLDEIAKKAGIAAGEAALEPLRPWTAALTISVIPMMRAGFDPKSGVEQVLKPEFAKPGKSIHGLETAAQQFHYFADLPQKQEVDYLATAMHDFDLGADQFRKLVDAWYAGDVAGLNDLFNGEFRDKFPELYKTLIVARNQSWIPKLSELLQGDGVSFVAVGAGHLAGPDGVPALLEKAGYKVERQ